MVIKSNLAKKLGAYSALATVMLAVNRKTDAQVIYTSVNPYFVGHDTSYLLDLNGDGIVDFKITQGVSTYVTYTTTHIGGIATSSGGTTGGFNNRNPHHHAADNVGIIAYNSNSVGANPLNSDIPINRYFTSWNRSQNLDHCSTSGFNCGGKWYGADTSYLALRIKVSGYTYYGWVRLFVTPSQFTVTGYAVNSVHSETILVSPNPVSNQLTITSSFLPLTAIQIYNEVGQTVINITFSNSSQKQTIDVSELSKGIYFYRIITNYPQNTIGKFIVIK